MMKPEIEYDPRKRRISIHNFKFQTPETFFNQGAYLETEYHKAVDQCIDVSIDLKLETEATTAHNIAGGLQTYTDQYVELDELASVFLVLDVECDESYISWRSGYDITEHLSRSDHNRLTDLIKDYISENPEKFESEVDL